MLTEKEIDQFILDVGLDDYVGVYNSAIEIDSYRIPEKDHLQDGGYYVFGKVIEKARKDGYRQGLLKAAEVAEKKLVRKGRLIGAIEIELIAELRQMAEENDVK